MSNGKYLYKNATIITMDPKYGTLKNSDLLIQDGRIESIGEDLSADGAEIIDAKDKILHPGFVDTHRHVWQSLLRGVAADWTIVDYMVQMRSHYCVCYEPEEAYIANYVGGLEAVNAGVTSVVDHSHLQITPDHSDALAKGLIDSGVGGFHCYGFYNNPEYKPGGPINVARETEMLTGVANPWHFENAKRIRDEYFPTEDNVLRFGVATSEIFYLPMETALIEIKAARELEAGCISMHWAIGSAAQGISGMMCELEEAGEIGSDLLLVHANDLNKAELEACGRHGVGISATPDTELGMGMGFLMQEAGAESGAPVSFGADICSNVAGDMFGQMRLALQYQRWEDKRPKDGDPIIVPGLNDISQTAEKYLRIGTLGGAEAIGMADEIGSLTPGKRADIVVVSTDGINMAPMQDPIAAILFYANIHDIEAVMINGKFKKRDGKLVGVDWPELSQKVKQAGAQIMDRHAMVDKEATMHIWSKRLQG